MLYVDVNAMDVETEADSNDVIECPHDDQQSSGMFGFFDCRFSTFNCCVCWVQWNTTRYPMKSNIQTWMLTFSCHAKTVSHITQVDLHSTSATQQLRDCTGFHIRITYIVSQKSIPLDVWQWLWQMWTNFQNFFTRWFVGKFSTYVYKDFHLTCNNLLHYLVKWNSKIQKSSQIFTLNMTINMIN